MPIEATVTVSVMGERPGVAHVAGIGRCGSPWACAVCTPVVREGRASEIDQGCAEALQRGWTVLMVSCTVPHSWGDALAESFGVVRSAHAKTRSGRPWRALRDGLDYRGSIRAWEMPHGRAGWHPHSHELLMFGRSLSDREVQAVKAHYDQVYGGAVLAATGRALHAVHGVDVRRVAARGRAGVGTYLCKVEGGWGAGLELARSDVKRSGASRNPWQILAAAADGEVGALRLWREYELATAGKRAITWSRGLRAELAGEDEATDAQLAAVVPGGEEVWSVSMPADQWCAVRRVGGLAFLLEECEERARAGPRARAPDG
jgi:hypothetical protein